jgi:O-Antigen ligase
MNLTWGQPASLMIPVGVWILAIAIATALEPLAGVGMAAIPLLLIWLSRSRNNVLLLLLFLAPFGNSMIIGDNAFGIEGAKITNVISFFVLFSMMFDTNMLQRPDKLEALAIRVMWIYIFLFIIVVARSIPNVATFRVLDPVTFQGEGVPAYILSTIVRPLTYVLPFYVILKRTRSASDINTIVEVIGISIFFLSCAVLAAIASDPGVLNDPTRDQVAHLFEQYFGLHYNNIGTIYCIVAPVMLYLAMRGKIFWQLNFVLMLATVFVLESRTSLIAVVIVSAAYLVLRRRTLLLTAAGGVAAVVLPFAVLPSVAALVSVGLSSTHEVTADSLFTGRIDAIWLPLLREWFSSPMLLLFGGGRFGIMTSPLWLTGQVYNATHAHNAFVDFFIDSGLPLLLVLVVSVVYFIRWAWKVGKRIDDPLFWALFLSVIGYLIDSITAGAIYPTYDNIELFPLLALLVNVARLHEPTRQRLANAGLVQQRAVAHAL